MREELYEAHGISLGLAAAPNTAMHLMEAAAKKEGDQQNLAVYFDVETNAPQNGIPGTSEICPYGHFCPSMQFARQFYLFPDISPR